MENWFKFYGGDYLVDPKMMSLTACEKSCWITILCYASMNDGYVKHLTEDQLMIASGIDPKKEEWRRTKGVLKKFEDLKMITHRKIEDKESDNGVIEVVDVVNWRKRQGKPAMTTYERLKKYRDIRSDDNGQQDDVDNGHQNEPQNEHIYNNIYNNNIYNIYSEEFQLFWNSYPKKIGKGDAYKSWTKLRPSKKLIVEILDSVENHKNTNQWKKNGGQFIPNPSTYLNQRRWEDELEEVKKTEIINLK